MRPLRLRFSQISRTTCVKASVSIFLCLFVLFSARGTTPGQVLVTSHTDGHTPSGLTAGTPTGSFPLSDFENVNPYSGALNFHFPLLRIGGRGSAGYTMMLPIETKWRVEHYVWPPPNPTCGSQCPWQNEQTVPVDYQFPVLTMPLAFAPGVMEFRSSGQGYTECTSNNATVYYVETLTRLTFTAADGTQIEFRDAATGGQSRPNPMGGVCYNGFNRGRVFVAGDGSAATFISDTDVKDNTLAEGALGVPTGYLLLADGSTYRVVDGEIVWMRDRNGNKVTGTTDPLGRQVTFTSGVYQGNPYTQISYAGSGGTPRMIKVWYGTLHDILRVTQPSDSATVKTFYQLFGALNLPSGLGSTAFDPTELVSRLEMPDGRSYRFFYNVNAELARVELPTGGAIEYDHDGGLYAGHTGIVNISDPSIYRRVVERRVYRDATNLNSVENRTTFSRPEATGNDSFVDVTTFDAASNVLSKVRHFYYSNASASFYLPHHANDYTDWHEGKEYKTEIYDANNNLLKRVENIWDQTPASAAENNPHITRVTTTLADVSPNLVSKQEFLYDQYNNQTDVDEYDFGSGSPGGLLRHTHTTYVTATAYTDAVTGAHLRRLPSQVSVFEGNNERSRTTYEYDNYGTADNYHATIQTYPRPNVSVDFPISGLDSGFNSQTSNLTRGNVTSVKRSLLANNQEIGSTTGYAQYDVAGNVVKTIDPRSTPTNIIATTIDYRDCFGWPEGDARINNLTPLSSAGYHSYAFPTIVTNALGHTAYSQYDFNTGQPVDGEDANGIVASGYSENDLLDRPTRVIRAANQGTSVKSQTTFSYDDANRMITNTSDQSSFNDNVLKGQSVYDKLGRTIESRTYEGGSNYIAVQTQYDALGRAFKVSNPFRPWKSETPVWTTFAYDALGRVVSVTTPDGAVVITAYSGNRVTVTDQAGKKRRSVTDALGRLIRVDEPDANNNLDVNGVPVQSTNYTYDVLDNLLTVTQGTQTRTFDYDSLKRLTSAINPESGTNSYQYDNNGNLVVKTDEARNVSTHFAYDALNRVFRKWYNGSNSVTATINNSPALPASVGETAEVTYTYDQSTNGKGRIWKTETSGDFGSRTAFDSYDSLGNPLIQGQQFYRAGAQDWSASFGVQRSYDRAGHVLTQTYPSGHSVSYNYDSAGRLADWNGQPAFSGNLGDGETRPYAAISGTNAYDAASRLQQEQYGTLTPLYHKVHYNVRGQLYDMRLSTQSWQAGELDGDRGAIVNYYSNQNFTPGYSGADNNGNTTRQETHIPGLGFFRDSFTYDSLNRLTSMSEKVNGGGNDTFKQSYLYDRWGNRRIDPANTFGPGINNLPSTIDPANNRLLTLEQLPVSYDQAGNLMDDGHVFTETFAPTYDAENRLTRVDYLRFYHGELVPTGQPPIQYIYDADGHRVRRIKNGTTWQVYGFEGELLAEYREGGALWPVITEGQTATDFLPQKEYGYRAGQLLITASSGDDKRIDRFITNFYFAALGREPSGEELSEQRTAFLQAGVQGQSQLVTAARTFGQQLFDLGNQESEYNQRNRSDQEFVTDLYFAYLQRLPDEGGLGYFLWQLQNGFTRVQVRDGFGTSSEFVALVSTVYGINIDSGFGRVWHYLSGMYAGVPGNSGDIGADLDTLNAAAAEGQTQVIQAAQTIATNLFQAWVEDTKDVSDEQFAAGLFHSFLQREPSFHELEGWTHTVHFDGRAQALQEFLALTATQELAGTLYREILWLTPDHLGTPRMISERSGSLAGLSRHDYLPFGEEVFAGTGDRTSGQGYTADDSVRQQFTLKERDNETGLDFFEARYYASVQGRFTSVDPLLSSAKTYRPQSWNRYSYCYNNPLRYLDPDGQKVKPEDEKALQNILNTLPENLREQIKLDKNGFIDEGALNKIKSTDANFLDLKKIVNSSQVMEVATAKSTVLPGVGRTEFAYKSLEAEREETIKALTPTMGEEVARDAANQIKVPTAFDGNTLTPAESSTGNLRVELSDQTGSAATEPDSAIAVTTAHEMYGHGLMFMQGKPFQHDNGGPVDKHIGVIERRTKLNFPEQPNRKVTPPK